MIVKNTKGARSVRAVAATMAISNMYMDKKFILKLIKVADGEMSSEELIEEIKAEYRVKKVSDEADGDYTALSVVTKD